MSLSYRRRKEANQKAKMVEGEAQLRRLMKAKPDQYPRWIFGVKSGGVLFQKCFPRKGTYTGKGHGKAIKVVVTRTFTCISTIAVFRSQAG